MNFHRNLLHSSFMIYWCPCRAASLLCLVVLSSSASSHIIGVNGFTASCLRRHLCPWHVSGDVAGAVSQLSSLCRGAGWFPTPLPPPTQTNVKSSVTIFRKRSKTGTSGGGVSLNSGTSGGGVIYSLFFVLVLLLRGPGPKTNRKQAFRTFFVSPKCVLKGDILGQMMRKWRGAAWL